MFSCANSNASTCSHIRYCAANTPRRGRDIEFSDFRRYRPGDDIRYIDWNIYSRLDRLFLKLYATEEDISWHVLMDVGMPTKFPPSSAPTCEP
jgi:uncharacterized protein (DUF58 family)